MMTMEMPESGARNIRESERTSMTIEIAARIRTMMVAASIRARRDEARRKTIQGKIETSHATAATAKRANSIRVLPQRSNGSVVANPVCVPRWASCDFRSRLYADVAGTDRRDRRADVNASREFVDVRSGSSRDWVCSADRLRGAGHRGAPR